MLLLTNKNLSMKRIFIILAVFSSVIILQSCEDAFNQVVPIKQDPVVPSLVPNAYLNNYDTATMFVSLTQELLSTANIKQVQNATITLFENNLDKGIMKRYVTGAADSLTYYQLENFVPSPGNVYSVTVSAPGYPTAEATDTMPTLVKIKATNTGNIVWKKITTPFAGVEIEDSFAEVKLTLPDVLGSDYYRIIIGQDYKAGFYAGNSSDQFLVLCNDYLYNEANANGGSLGSNLKNLGDTYFSDQLFDGTQKEILLYIPLGKTPFVPPLEGTVYFYLQHHSRASFLHNNSLSDYSQTENNPFAQPVLIYSNYKNGFGILGCSSTSVDSLKF